MVYSCFPRAPSSLVTRREGSFYGRVKAVNILVTQETPRLETSTRHGSSVKRGGPVVLAPVALRLFIEVNLSLRRVYTVYLDDFGPGSVVRNEDECRWNSQFSGAEKWDVHVQSLQSMV